MKNLKSAHEGNYPLEEKECKYDVYEKLKKILGKSFEIVNINITKRSSNKIKVITQAYTVCVALQELVGGSYQHANVPCRNCIKKLTFLKF